MKTLQLFRVAQRPRAENSADSPLLEISSAELNEDYLVYSLAKAQCLPSDGGPSYSGRAVVPSEAIEVDLPHDHIPTPPVDWGRALARLRLPREIKTELSALVTSLTSRNGMVSASDRCLELLSGVGIRADKPHFLGVKEDCPGWRTLTVNQDQDRRIGLHVDNWDNHSLEERASSRTRLCVNFGPGPRYIAVVPFCLDLFGGDKKRDTSPGDVIQEILADCERQYAILLRVLPGEAYLAPTENVIHDGSTIGVEQPNLHATWLGKMDVAVRCYERS